MRDASLAPEWRGSVSHACVHAALSKRREQGTVPVRRDHGGMAQTARHRGSRTSFGFPRNAVLLGNFVVLLF